MKLLTLSDSCNTIYAHGHLLVKSFTKKKNNKYFLFKFFNKIKKKKKKWDTQTCPYY